MWHVPPLAVNVSWMKLIKKVRNYIKWYENLFQRISSEVSLLQCLYWCVSWNNLSRAAQTSQATNETCNRRTAQTLLVCTVFVNFELFPSTFSHRTRQKQLGNSLGDGLRWARVVAQRAKKTNYTLFPDTRRAPLGVLEHTCAHAPTHLLWRPLSIFIHLPPTASARSFSLYGG